MVVDVRDEVMILWTVFELDFGAFCVSSILIDPFDCRFRPTVASSRPLDLDQLKKKSFSPFPQSERTHAVKGAIHAPAHALRADGPDGEAALDAVLSEAAARGASEVVVHCALSQVR